MTRFVGGLGEIAVATRSGYEESVHHGAAVALDAAGEPVATVGDPDLAVYPRSCLKPMQAFAMLGAGLTLPDDLLAIACASHDGTPTHLAAVRSILSTYGLDESDLQNTPSRPSGAGPRAQARAAGIGPTSLQQNCSGKHAAMLATCRVNDWPIETYLEPDHPLQVAIIAGIESLGASVEHVGVDGCGAPTHVISLQSLAGAFATLAAPDSAIGRAMSSNPIMVGGPDRDVTLWTESVPTLMTKDGADGVMAGALGDGRAFAFKIADGSADARQAVTPQALREIGVDVDGVAAATLQRVAVAKLGHGRIVGHIEALGWTPWSS